MTVYGKCRTCGRDITKKKAARCEECRERHPDRHVSRSGPEQMFVSIDGEGISIDDNGNPDASGTRMRLVTLSFGREDGTSETWSGNDAKAALFWLRERVIHSYRDTNGKLWKQVPVAFHFTWDMSVISTYFDPSKMLLVHKARPKETNLLCDIHHRDYDPPCTKPYHRRRIKDINDVITDGGEGDVIAWDSISKLAIAATPKRRFYCEYRPNGDRYDNRGAILDIHDTGSAFVGGLLTAIDKWKPELSEDQQSVIEWGKKHRKDGTFSDELAPQIAKYSEAECVAHARMCRQLVNAIRDAAGIIIKPSQLYGSGSVAAIAFDHHRISQREQSETCNDVIGNVTIDDIAWLTYFGGLIETPVVGLVRGLVNELDLNSAYPAEMIHLPCMRSGHGKWNKSRRYQNLPAHTIGHVLVSWIVETPSTGPFMVRDADMLVYAPLTGTKIWVTLPEYQAAIEQFPNDIITHNVIWWEQTCDCPLPFSWVGTLYHARQNLKKELKNHPKGSAQWQALKCREEAIKLIINSCYGKLAQRRPQLGKYTNLHYAAMITGATRAKVRRETWLREKQGGLPVYQHTDSVLSVGGSPEDGGSDLGAWGIEDKPTIDFVIVQPGLASSIGNTDGKQATRGVSKESFAVAIETWGKQTDFTQHPSKWPEIIINQKRMYSRRLAIAQGNPNQAGAFLPMQSKLNPGTAHKRNIEAAYQAPNRPEAWIVPPIDFVSRPVREPIEIKLYQQTLINMERNGEFDGELSTALMAGESEGTNYDDDNPDYRNNNPA